MTAGTTYFYVVKAVNSTVFSPSSNEAEGIPSSNTSPSAPTNLTAAGVSSSEIDLAWTAATGTVTGYNVFRGTAAGGESSTPINTTPLSSSTTSYHDTSVTTGTTYFYVVQAINNTGSSPVSNEANATASSNSAPGRRCWALRTSSRRPRSIWPGPRPAGP